MQVRINELYLAIYNVELYNYDRKIMSCERKITILKLQKISNLVLANCQLFFNVFILFSSIYVNKYLSYLGQNSWNGSPELDENSNLLQNDFLR